MAVFRDMLGHEVLLERTPARIVSLVPSQTELLYDLGLEEETVGITKFCVHPEAWFRSKERVGGTKTVHAEKVAALKPDLIIANKEENVKEQIEALKTIAPVWVSDIKNLEDSLQMIRSVGAICNKESKAIQLAEAIRQGFASLPRSPSARKKIAYCIWRNPWMWAGSDTFISDLLNRCGWQNALENENRYPSLELNAIAAHNPQIIMLSSEPYPFRESHIAEVQSILPDVKILLVDGEMFSWYGSRLLKAVPYLNTLIQQIK